MKRNIKKSADKPGLLSTLLATSSESVQISRQEPEIGSV